VSGRGQIPLSTAIGALSAEGGPATQAFGGVHQIERVTVPAGDLDHFTNGFLLVNLSNDLRRRGGFRRGGRLVDGPNTLGLRVFDGLTHRLRIPILEFHLRACHNQRGLLASPHLELDRAQLFQLPRAGDPAALLVVDDDQNSLIGHAEKILVRQGHPPVERPLLQDDLFPGLEASGENLFQITGHGK
jgi:hypothetical protein